MSTQRLSNEVIERLRALEFESDDETDFPEKGLVPVDIDDAEEGGSDSYSFAVDETRKIDFNRVIEEQQAAGNPVSLVEVENQSFVMISNEFLRKFECFDRVVVMCEFLDDAWGNKVFYVRTKQFCLHAGRFMLVKGDTDMAKVAADIKAAMQYKRKIVVNVTTIS